MKSGWRITIILMLLIQAVVAQRPFGIQNAQQEYQKAVDLFYQAKYAPARRALEDYVWKNNPETTKIAPIKVGNSFFAPCNLAGLTKCRCNSSKFNFTVAYNDV